MDTGNMTGQCVDQAMALVIVTAPAVHYAPDDHRFGLC